MGSDEFSRHGGWEISDGGTCGNFDALLCKYGIVPQHVFPDNYQSQHSGSVGALLTVLMKQACLRIFVAHGDLAPCKEGVMTHVHAILCAFLGTPPGEVTKFKFNWPTSSRMEGSFASTTGSCDGVHGGGARVDKQALKSYTPRRHVQAHHDTDNDTGLTVTVDPRHSTGSWIAPIYSCDVLSADMDPDRMHQQVWARCFNLPSTRDVKQAVLHSLKKARLPVAFMCDVSHHFDKRLHLLAFDATPGVVQRLLDVDVWNMPKADAYAAHVVETNHAMTFIGYDAEDDVWEVENSWGDSQPITMSGAWFDRFVTTVNLRRGDVMSVASAAVKRALKDARVPVIPNAEKWTAASGV